MNDDAHWFDYEGAAIWRTKAGGAYGFRTSHVALDADGSPRAYHPDDIGIDYNANAGYPHQGWRGVLVVDPKDGDRPYVQTAGRYRGYFVSKTSLRDPRGRETDPSTYVDAETFPYIVFPGAFYAVQGTGRYGDLAMVRSLVTGRETAAIVADGGPAKSPLGEMSLACAKALGGVDPNPRTGAGAPGAPIECIVFPGSAFSPAWPQDWSSVVKRCRELFAAAGGWRG